MISAPVRLAGATILILALAVEWTLGQTPALPVIPSYLTNILSAGALGNDSKDNTTNIQNAINGAATAGGGTVEFPSGTYLSGPLTLPSSINLQFDSGAILRMLPYGTYPGGTSPSDFITTSSSAHDLELSGPGTIDGQAEGSGWWLDGLPTSERPVMFYFDKCDRVLIENVTIENSPSMHIVFKNGGGNITVSNLTINTPVSPNTDGIDLIGTNCLVENSSISDGDDNIALGSSSAGATSSGTLVTNCAFGIGHGMSIGGNTAGGVSNLLVINCTFNGTTYGVRLKSDNATSSGGEGGLTQNCIYENLGMTNIVEGAIVIYSYYNEYGTPIGITPATAASQSVPAPSTTTCIWRNILFSNITATVSSGGTAGIIWGRTELPATNITLQNVNISAPATFDVYNTRGFQFLNSQITVPGSKKTFTVFNAGLILTNTAPTSGSVTLDGLLSTNTLALYNQSLSTTATDIFGADPVTVSGGTLTVNTNYNQPASEAFNFALGTNASIITATKNLAFNNATINLTSAPGFAPGLYTLFTYGGSKSGSYSLGTTVPGYNFLFYTNTPNTVQLIASPSGMSLTPTNIMTQLSSGQLQLSWPTSYTGWFLEVQTNQADVGLSNNWTFLPATAATNVFSLTVDPNNNDVFFRLFYP